MILKHYGERYDLRFTKEKERALMYKIRNERGEITMNNTEMQMYRREYCEQLLSVNKLDSLEEGETFLESHKLSRLNQEEI